MTDPYLDRFSGIARLYGTAALEKFRGAHVAVVGVGGVGCWAAECLARSGIGKVTMIDADDLCVTNTNRQIHAHDGTYGKPKVGVMAARLRSIQPEIVVTERQEFLSDRNVDDFLDGGFDAVIDAIDAVRAKCVLLARCRERKVPVIACGGAGGRRDPAAIRVTDLARTRDDALLMAVRKRLRDEHGFPKARPGEKVKKFRIEAVYSEEPPLYPTCEGTVSHERPEDMPGGLRCDAGYGTATHVTAVFGMIAAGRALAILSGTGETS
ncbi:tRNA threonylcarbamoyladenosine dehydratase [Haloferula sp. BvORR071]|uniref:tRNA threonylcarbamoyladenosine dehydratase n=1 Tax=Haloferula sp. BvORR071 TaxID=1396141 RepID=UPI00054D9ABE|nr:tRNA threonylcarbamoyladenosine dehydratase [Haloferula sp. BvORR071]